MSASSYRRNMRKWFLPQDELETVKKICYSREHDDIVKHAVTQTTCRQEETGRLLFRHVTEPEYSYMYMQLDGLTLNPESFRVLRAQFYWRMKELCEKPFDYISEGTPGCIMSAQDEEEGETDAF